LFSDLLDIDIVREKRISIINSFDDQLYPALVNTEIIQSTNRCTLKQKKIKTISIKKVQKKDFLTLIKTLNYFEKIGFVHGDLNKKNIINTEDGFRIIDYEPSILQISNGLKQYMVTKPYISKLDLLENSITIRTDKIGFFYFVLRVYKLINFKDLVALSKTFNHKKWLKLNENQLKYTSYSDLLDLALDKLK